MHYWVPLSRVLVVVLRAASRSHSAEEVASKLEVEIGEWRIRLPETYVRLNEQTFFRSQPHLGQFQISTAKHVSGPEPAWDASALKTSLFQMAKNHGFPRPGKIQEIQTNRVTVVCGDLGSNGTYVGRM